MQRDTVRTESPSGQPTIDEQKKYWDQRWDRSKYPNNYQLARSSKVLEYLNLLKLNQPKILDLGCGTGWFTEQLSHFGDAIGLDLSETAIAVAKSRFPSVNFIAGNLYELSLPKENFDLIIAQEVIAHVEDQTKFVDLITRLLKPKGYLILTTVNKFVIERTYQPPDPPEHIKDWLSMKDLKRLFRNQFRLLKSTTVIPMGERGILKFAHSCKVNSAVKLVLGQHRIDALKDWAGCGYTRVLLLENKAH